MKLSQVALPLQAARQAQRRQIAFVRLRSAQTGQQPFVESAQRFVRFLHHPTREVDRRVRLASFEFSFVKEPQAGDQK